MAAENVNADLLFDVQDRVAVLTINRPHRMNAWTAELETRFRAAMLEANAHDDVRCIVVAGAGGAFCAGMDMHVLKAGPAQQRPMTESTKDLDQRYGYLAAIDKPLIAAIDGPAIGVGLCLALFCDLRFITARSKLSTPYSRRGLVAEHGTAWLLPRLIGPMHAADMLLSGRIVLGEEAGRMGLATLLPEDGFLGNVLARASEMANLCSPRSVRIIKQQLALARYQTLGEATLLADHEIRQCRSTEDFREGVQHFMEKRAPDFTGN